MKMANLERLKRMLTDDLKALRDGKSVLGVDEMADSIEMVGAAFTVNANEIRSSKSDLARLATEYAIVLTKLDTPA